MILRSAREHYARQQQLTAKGLAAARRARWGSLPRLAAIMALFQQAVAKDAVRSSGLMLAEQGLDVDLAGVVAAGAFAGITSDGRAMGPLLDLTRTRGMTDYAFGRIVTTQLQDTARAASSVALVASPAATGYVRMLNLPSCSRCAVLAGKEYKWNAGFQRHPLCDCRHIPAAEDTWDDLATDPRAYFDSLPSAESLREQYPDLTVAMRRDLGLYSQEDIFTKHGARAIRDGADIGRVVNARRGMRTAAINQRGWIPRGRMAREDVFGRQVYTTTTLRKQLGERTSGRGRPYVRLMPESIYEIADNRADALRLLRRYGYLT